MVTARPTAIIYSGDWPPEQAPRGLFKRYEVRGRVCEVVPHILFLRKDDAPPSSHMATTRSTCHARPLPKGCGGDSDRVRPL